MAFVCSRVFLVSCQQTTAVFVTSPKPVVVKLLREFKNGSRLHTGGPSGGSSSGQDQTDSGTLETKFDSTPEGQGIGWCADTLVLEQFKQRAECFGGVSRDVFRSFKVLPGGNMPGNSLQEFLEQRCTSASSEGAFRPLYLLVVQ